jgi:ABC-type nitrate/sulfonate/bicarbonate transport system ATPase subunit
VSKVWNAVDAHTRKDMTSVIHGKWAHEESIATASFADTYLIVKDIHEAEYVADYVLNGGDRAEFMRKFKNAMSEGFDPDTDLDKVRARTRACDGTGGLGSGERPAAARSARTFLLRSHTHTPPP